MSFNKRVLSPGASPFVNNENFKAVLYTGNGGTQSITGVGFKPDMVWLKNRSQNNYAPRIFDSTRGATKRLQSSTSAAESTDSTSLTSFDSDGFTLGSDNYVNNSGDSFVAWCFKASAGSTSSNSNGSITSTVQANKNAGFSIVKYTGSGSSASVGHGLASAPKLIFSKRIASSSDWLAGAIDWTKYLEPNGTPPFRTANVWTNSAPTSTTFGVINSTSASSVEYINYCWADVVGYQKIDSYEGNGSTNGVMVNVGFEPALVMVKNVDSTDNWLVFDNKRNTSNPRTQLLQWNLSNAEGTEAGAQMNFYSNGFQSVGEGGGAGSGQINANGDTYLYLAIAANPDTEEPTLASSFNVETYIGTGASRSITGLGFGPGLVWIKHRDGTGSHSLTDVVRGDDLVLQSNETSTEASGQINLDSDGFTIRNDNALRNANGSSYVAWNWKADDNEPTINENGSITSITSVNANAGFSIVKYHGNSGSSGTIGHGLSAAPELIITKARNFGAGWPTQSGGFFGIRLNESGANQSGNGLGFYDNTSPTSTVYTVGGSDETNDDYDYIAYCFHSVTGYSKVGTYTGTGSSNSITTGFKTDFLIVKEADGTDSWEMYDSLRGSNKVVYTNGNNAEVTGSTLTSFDSNGFTVSSATSINESGKTYIYWAVAKNVPSNTTLANSFKAITYTGNGGTQSITGFGFRPDFVWGKNRDASEAHFIYDSLRGASKLLESNSTIASTTVSSRLTDFESDGFTIGGSDGSINASGNDYVAWGWKAGNTWQSNLDGTQASLVNANTANGFSIVKWTTNGSSSQTVGHGLSSTPELIIFKRLDSSQDWFVETNAIDGGYDYANLNTSDAFQDGGAAWSTRATSTTITNFTSSNNFEYIAYCFHSVSGYSKIGTYTGNSSTQSITGVGFQPDWLMIKQTNASNSWRIFDSARGLSSPQTLFPNLDSVEDSESNTVSSFDSDGWTMGSQQGVNDNGDTYIYMAFKIN